MSNDSVIAHVDLPTPLPLELLSAKPNAIRDESPPLSNCMTVATSVFDTLVSREDLRQFGSSTLRWKHAGATAYDKVRTYLGLAEDEKLRVGHLARIDFNRADAYRDVHLNGQLPGIISAFLNLKFGLAPRSTPTLWTVPD